MGIVMADKSKAKTDGQKQMAAVKRRHLIWPSAR
jgi:hypothetical protein